MLHLLIILLLAGQVDGQIDLSKSSPHGADAPACDKCHIATSWDVIPQNITFDHQSTEFPLLGRHGTVTCRECHADLHFSSLKTACKACHSDIHQGQFNDDCDKCHSPFGWRDPDLMRLLHNETRFPLLAGHANVSCDHCHTQGKYRGSPLECLVCHKKEWEATTAPVHNAVGFPSNCAICHTDVGWSGAFYDHRMTSFPLIGRHRYTTCNACHTGNNYRAVTTWCLDCHSDDYNRATNPNHRALAFPLDCSKCHSPDGWQGKYTHAFFPIYSGSHNNTWRACTDCHPDGSNFAVFTCLSCHLRPQMDSKHREERGYSYDSNACLRCHPDGKEDD